ncbi:MAG: rhomboid family intramembrane serine protease [Bacteroidota bacterium]|nr:rhomboid family intramembrane serine protease [Bacteroidota bacterium]
MSQIRPQGFRILPPVVKNLLIINGIFFLATIALGKYDYDLADILGLHYFGSEKFKPYQLITYMFMHGGFSHIFFNMFALWMFGNAIENIWGAKRFLIYYLITGFGAALLHYGIFYLENRALIEAFNNYIANPYVEETQRNLVALINPILNHPVSVDELNIEFVERIKMSFLNQPVVIGASGAVFGILLAFGMMFPNSLLYLYFAIPIKAKYFVIFYGLAELWFGVSNMGSGNIAHFAHVGGMIFGFLLLKYWNIKRLN